LNQLDLRDILVDAGRFERKGCGKGIYIDVPILAFETEETAHNLLFGINVQGGLCDGLGKGGIDELIRIGGAHVAL